ncbi:MAG: DedA family protein [Paludibacteraceae bacterium]|nr:DedA family protein [Paludibacteraceae bacterium]
METIIQFINSCLEHLNYGTITLLMAIESSFIPFPSEIIVPPAGYLAAEGKLDISLVIFFSTLGSLIGATINYYLAYVLGRPILYKFVNSKIGHMCLLSQEGLERAENYFNKNGAISTFVGRLLPAIRQLISIPAGLVKLNFFKFVAYTTLGAGIWNCILAFIGYMLHKSIGNIDEIPEIAKHYGHYISLVIIVVLVIAALIYYFRMKARKAHKEAKKILRAEEEQDQIENI